MFLFRIYISFYNLFLFLSLKRKTKSCYKKLNCNAISFLNTFKYLFKTFQTLHITFEMFFLLLNAKQKIEKY